MKYAWVENGRIRDISQGNPSETYHPDIAAFYTVEVPDNAENGDGFVNGQIIKPEPPAPPPIPERTWSEVDVRNGLTLIEKVRWDSTVIPEIVTAKKEMSQPLTVTNTTEVLNFLVSTNNISQASADKILL
jgi:hypothetical protein